MDVNKLENGSYVQRESSPTTPLPSSPTTLAAVLYVENEIFDHVQCQREVRKKKVTSIIVPNGSGPSEEGFDYHQRNSSPAEPEPVDAPCCSKKTKRWCCNVIVAVTLLTIIGLFTLPIIFYYVDVPKNADFNQTEANTLRRLLDDCLNNSEDVMTKRMIPDSICYNYTGVCLDYLQMTAMMYGIPTTNDSVKVMNNPQVSNPDSLVNLFTNIDLVSDNCERDGLPLLCNYFYLVCNSSGDSPVVLSNLEEGCVNVSQGTCQSVWELPIASTIVPNCNELDANVPPNTCHPQFDIRCGVCIPICEDFSETPEDTQNTIDVFFIIAACLMIVGSILVLIVSVIRRDVMFDFPSVLIVYMTLIMMVIGVLVLVSFGARKHLYCSEPELPIAYENPTLFCQLSGFVIHAGFVQIVLYWLLHLVHLFFKFFFPFAIRRVDTKNWKRAFHFGEVIFVNVATSIAPIYVLTKSKYYPYGYPPNLCVPNASLTFYTALLPIIVFLCTGTCLIVLMFWRLQLRTGFIEKSFKTLNCFKLTTPEVKMLILLCFFLVFGISNTVYFSLYARNYEFLISLSTEYILCQAKGRNDSCEIHKDEIQEYRYHGLANTCYLLMGMLTISNLLFAVHVKQLKGQIRKLSKKASATFRSLSVKEMRVTAASHKPSEQPYKLSSADEY